MDEDFFNQSDINRHRMTLLVTGHLKKAVLFHEEGKKKVAELTFFSTTPWNTLEFCGLFELTVTRSVVVSCFF